MTKTYFKIGAMAIAALATVSACKKKNDDPVAPKGTGFLNVIHASPGGGSLDVYLRSTRVTSALRYLQATGYLSREEGSANLAVNDEGSLTTKSQANVDIGKSQYSSAYIIPSSSNPSQADIFQLRDTISTVGTTKARIRFVNLAANLGGTAGLTQDNGRVITGFPASRNFKEFTRFVDIDPGTIKFELRNAVNEIKDTVRQGLEAGKYYTFSAVGDGGSAPVNGNGLRLLVTRNN